MAYRTGVFRHESRKPRFYFSKREIQENDKTGNQRGECIEGIGSTETGYNILYPFYQITSEFDEKTKNKLEYVKILPPVKRMAKTE